MLVAFVLLELMVADGEFDLENYYILGKIIYKNKLIKN